MTLIYELDLYTKYELPNDLVMLLRCTELRNHLQGFTNYQGAGGSTFLFFFFSIYFLFLSLLLFFGGEVGG